MFVAGERDDASVEVLGSVSGGVCSVLSVGVGVEGDIELSEVWFRSVLAVVSIWLGVSANGGGLITCCLWFVDWGLTMPLAGPSLGTGESQRPGMLSWISSREVSGAFRGGGVRPASREFIGGVMLRSGEESTSSSMRCLAFFSFSFLGWSLD